jgi:SET domain-containing protein
VKRLILAGGETGRGVFAGQRFHAGEEILTFTGRRMMRWEIPPFGRQEEDFYLQVDHDVFIGPSGEIDDYVNHSCDPNGGVVIVGDSARLIAIKAIEPGQEIRFDYSTTMRNPILVMTCSCGSAICRGRVDDFDLLPGNIQERYKVIGIVPDYVTRRREPADR